MCKKFIIAKNYPILLGLSRYILRPSFRLLSSIGFSKSFVIPVRLKTGDVLLCRPLLLTDFLMWAGLYETHVGKVFSPKAGQTVIDVGAHIGYYTVQCARLIGEQGTVIAIEPDPRNFALLMRNLRLNKLSNVIALNMALGAINGVIPFLLSDDPANSRCGEGFIYKVKIQRLDDVLMELGINDVDWIKIDIEGYETEVIRGAINTFKSNKKLRLIMEVHQIDILPFMQELGFTYKQLSYNPFSRFGNYYFEKV